MKTALTRFKVKEGKADKVKEWFDFLNSHLKETELTLNGEKIYVESIFKETIDNQTYLYWYTLEDDESGQNVVDSKSPIDKVHLDYWYDCIDESVPSVDLSPQLLLVQNTIKEKIIKKV